MAGHSRMGQNPRADPRIPLSSLTPLLGYQYIIWSWPNLSSMLFSKVLLEAAWEWEVKPSEMVSQSPTPTLSESQDRRAPYL